MNTEQIPEISGEHAWSRVSPLLGLHSITTTASLAWPDQFTHQPLINIYKLVSHTQTNLALSATY